MRADHRYHEGLRLFREQRWFECHEVLEELWRETPRGPAREYLQGLIQLAVSLEHWRRENPRGAWGQWRKAQARLAGLPPDFEGVAVAELVDAFRALWSDLRLEDAVTAQATGGSWPRPSREWPAPRWIESLTGDPSRRPPDASGARHAPTSTTGLEPAHSARTQRASGCASAGSVRDSRSGSEPPEPSRS